MFKKYNNVPSEISWLCSILFCVTLSFLYLCFCVPFSPNSMFSRFSTGWRECQFPEVTGVTLVRPFQSLSWTHHSGAGPFLLLLLSIWNPLLSHEYLLTVGQCVSVLCVFLTAFLCHTHADNMHISQLEVLFPQLVVF